MSCQSYVLFSLNLFLSPHFTERCGVGGPTIYSTGGLCCYSGAYSCCNGFGMTFFIGANRTAMCCGTDPHCSFLCPFIGSFAVGMSKCRDFSSALFFSAHTTSSSCMYAGFCTSGRSFAITHPGMGCVNVFGCCCCTSVTVTGNSTVFGTFPIMTQSIELSCFYRCNGCCRFIYKDYGASSTGPISKRARLSTGCRLSYCFSQAMTKLFNGKYCADCAGGGAYQTHYPRLFSVGSNRSNVVCTTVNSTGRCLVSFCLLYSNYSYFFSHMTVVLTRTACYKMIYMVAIFIN